MGLWAPIHGRSSSTLQSDRMGSDLWSHSRWTLCPASLRQSTMLQPFTSLPRYQCRQYERHDCQGPLSIRTALHGEEHKTSKLTEHDVYAIRTLRAQGLFCKTIAAKFGVHPNTVLAIGRRIIWKHLPEKILK